MDDRGAGTNRDEPRHDALERKPEVEQTEGPGDRQRNAEQQGAAKLVGPLRACRVLQEVQDRDSEPDQQANPGQCSAHDQRGDSRIAVSLAEVGEYVETRDDAQDEDRQDVEPDVGSGGKNGQVFAGVVAPPLPWRKSISCWTRSIGTGKTITVLRSTPISVRVCR